MRKTEIKRNTAETEISLSLNIDGVGKSSVDTCCGFLNHMLTLFAKHGHFDIEIKCVGDYDVDYHHTTEDCGIVLGEAFKEALEDKKGIKRYGDIILPMDDALIMASVDVSGRSYLSYCAETPAEKVGDFDTELAEEFWQGFVRSSGITLHVKKLDGKNSHHIIEGVFKAVARILDSATEIDDRFANEVPSSKGVL